MQYAQNRIVNNFIYRVKVVYIRVCFVCASKARTVHTEIYTTFTRFVGGQTQFAQFAQITHKTEKRHNPLLYTSLLLYTQLTQRYIEKYRPLFREKGYSKGKFCVYCVRPNFAPGKSPRKMVDKSIGRGIKSKTQKEIAMSKKQWGHGFHRGVEKAMEASNGTLIGLWFHSNHDGHLGWQGKIEKYLGAGTYLVQLFDWFMGTPSIQKIIPDSAMSEWHFFATSEDMKTYAETHWFKTGK